MSVNSVAPTTKAAEPPDEDHGDPRRWKALALLALVQFMFALDLTIVNPALPSIKNDLHFSDSSLAWVVNGYTLVAGGFLILGGRAADTFGRRRMFIVGTIIFALASLTSGLAQSEAMLIGSRFAQGLGEALAAPAALSIVVLLFRNPTERAKAIGAWGGITAMGATFGVMISGVVIDAVSWRWVFLVNLPVALIVIFVVPRMVQESRVNERRRIDVVGALLITSALTFIVYGLLKVNDDGWGGTSVVVPLVVGIALLVAFVGSQTKIREPLIPLRFFQNRTRVSANLATMLSGASFLVMFFVLTLYMQDVLDYSPLKAGMAWGPFGFALFAGIAISMKLLPSIGVKRGLMIAFSTSAVGLFLLSGIGTDADYAGHILPGMLIMAVGQGISFPAVQNAGLHGLGHADAGLGSAVQNTSQQFGGSIGLAVLLTIALNHTSSRAADGVAPASAAVDGYSLALLLCAAVLVVAVAAVAAFFERVDFVPPDQQAIEAAEAAAGATAAA